MKWMMMLMMISGNEATSASSHNSQHTNKQTNNQRNTQNRATDNKLRFCCSFPSAKWNENCLDDHLVYHQYGIQIKLQERNWGNGMEWNVNYHASEMKWQAGNRLRRKSVPLLLVFPLRWHFLTLRPHPSLRRARKQFNLKKFPSKNKIIQKVNDSLFVFPTPPSHHPQTSSWMRIFLGIFL